jgi:CBS domain-containing protein
MGRRRRRARRSDTAIARALDGLLTRAAPARAAKAAALLADKNITSALVLDAAEDLVGMVSEVDLLPGALEPAPELASRPAVVADVMSEDVVVAPDTDLANVAKAMLDYEVRCLPVIADTELVGVVSRRDIMRSVIRTDEVIRLEVQNRLDTYAGERRWSAAGTAVVSGEFDDQAQRALVRVLAHAIPGVTGVVLRPPTRRHRSAGP